MNKRLFIGVVVIITVICSVGVILRIGLPRYREYITYNTCSVEGDTNVDSDPDDNDSFLEDSSLDASLGAVQEHRIYRSEMRTSRGGTYSAMSVTSSTGSNGEAVYTADNGVVIKIMQGDYSNYLTNKTVLLDIHYPEDVDKTISVGGEATRTLSTCEGEFNYVVRVRENVVINAGGVEFDVIKNIVEVETGCQVYEDSSNSKNNNGYVKNKTYYSARLGGIIKNSEGVAFTTDNVKELGIRYWRNDIDEIFTVKYNKSDMLTVSNNNNFKVVDNTGGVLRFEILARSLKENTTYYMQAYMMNADGEILLGDVKEFATRSQEGVGLYGLYYDSISSSDPTTIKQETVDTMKFTGLNHDKVRWVGEIIPINNGVMKFRTTTDADSGSIKISNGTADIYKGETDSNVDTINIGTGTNTYSTNLIYTAGQKYKIIIEAQNVKDFKLEWMEDGQYQEVPKTQLYPKEYIKIASAVINSVGTNKQTIGSDGKLINKKIITNGQNMSSCSIEYSNDVASSVTIGGTAYKIIHQSNDAYRVGASLPNDSNLCTIEGWIVYNTNNVVEPIIENVVGIDYSNKKVTLRNGSEWVLYADNGVDIVGRVVVRKKNGNELYEVYDLGRYISSSTTLSDGKSYDSSKVYKTVEEDDTHVMNLTQQLNESDTYQKTLNQYSTMEHFVEDSKPVSKKWNLGIGEGRIFSLVPIRMLISFDGDEQFTMSDPVIKISKKLYRVKNGATAKEGENVLDLSSEDNIFCLDFPTDVKKKTDSKKNVTSLKYADWRYMDASGGEGTTKKSVKMEDDGDYITITLESLDVNKEAKDAPSKTNIMLNFVVRLDSKGDNKDKTSDEIFKSIQSKLINDSYKTFTNVEISSVKTSTENDDRATVKVLRLPVEVKVKPQVTFE